jgi:2-methylcitrate dehydratase PrpD
VGVSRHIASWVSGLEYDELSELAVERIRVAVLDYLGCALAGSATDTGSKLLGYLDEVGRDGPATAVGTTRHLTPPDAALLNGTFGHALDYDDVSFHMIGHPGVTILPAVLALGEAHHRSGADVMTAYAAGYEVAARLGYAMNVGGHYEKGWHATGTLGTMGAAAGSCRVLGLDADITAQAIGMAASMAAGLRQNFGRDTKPFHAGRAAQNGVTAAMLASRGFTAEPDILEAPFGFFSVYGGPDRSRPERLEEVPGPELEIASPGFQTKIYPSCASTHTALDAMLSLISECDIDYREVAEIDVAVVHLTPKILIHTNPTEGLEGKFSMQYCLARALRSRVLSTSHFSDDAVREPDIRHLMSLVNMHVDPELDRVWSPDRPRPVILTVTLGDGSTYQRRVDIPTGLPENPASRQQVVSKYHDLADPVLGSDRSGQVVSLTEQLSEVSDVRELMAACAAS